jgi:hypothetical protein
MEVCEPTPAPQANAAVEPVLEEASLVEGILSATMSSNHE